MYSHNTQTNNVATSTGVRQGSVEAPTAQETKQAQATPAKQAPAPVATQANVKVTKAELVKQAQALGMTVKVANSMRKDKLAKTIEVLRALE